MSRVPSDFPDRTVCIFGQGYVGLTLAAVMADIGFDVIGTEIRDDVLACLKKGKAHFHEPGLDDLVGKLVARGRLHFKKHLDRGDKPTVFIVTVGTPLGANGKVNLSSIQNVSDEIAKNLKPGDMVIMRSTVKLGTTRRIVIPILDSAGVDYDVAFCPERTLEGQALPELRHLPQIVGSVSPRARIRAAQLFSFLTPTVVQVSSLETAETIKLIDNTQRDVAFAFANEVARICDAIGVSAREVIQSGKLGYPRTNLPLPGPVGGPCLEKDPHIMVEGLREVGLEPEITIAARRINERQPAETVAEIKRWLESKPGFNGRPVVTLAGLAFKGRPATDDLRGTMARPILASLREGFPQARFRGFDAVVPPEIAKREFDVEPVTTLEQAFDGANLVVLANNHPCFAGMPVERLAERMAAPGLIYDYWNNFDGPELNLPDGIRYMALGSHRLVDQKQPA
jgi:UDP-N-acetyl-D-mannosaminuronic acid dehydrogenase